MLDELLTHAPHSDQRKSLWQSLVLHSEGALLTAGRKADGEEMVFTAADRH